MQLTLFWQLLNWYKWILLLNSDRNRSIVWRFYKCYLYFLTFEVSYLLLLFSGRHVMNLPLTAINPPFKRAVFLYFHCLENMISYVNFAFYRLNSLVLNYAFGRLVITLRKKIVHVFTVERQIQNLFIVGTIFTKIVQFEKDLEIDFLTDISCYLLEWFQTSQKLRTFEILESCLLVWTRTNHGTVLN